ncbi:ABC transporter substrate-binding protein [uncultured Oscillibacter sp.]|uniref:ABC transporter substrate-binding protein n=1 Tax=uncultured Oscillibacter sp. TaxID=876091 RepID=UPI0028058F3D|nr:ABC transporter substrate-binding protein [uncultured Oscillibacter sp.]
MNKIFGRVCSALTAAALLAGALTACGGQQAGTAAPDSGTTGSAFTEGTSAERLAADTTPEEEKYGGTMRLNFNGATNSLDPAQFFTNQNYVPGYHIYESPVQVADDGSVWPGVCTYEMSDDNLQLTLTVREGVKFHNGDTVDINDVVASIDRFLAYSTTGQANFGDYIVDTQVTDNSTVVYTLSAVAPIALLTIGELKGGCKVMPAEIAQAHMDSYITDDSEIVGTGPYMLESWNRETDLTLTRFEDYVPVPDDIAGTGPAAPRHAYFDKIYCSVASDQTARANGMIGNVFDYSTSILTAMAPQLENAGCWSDKDWNGWSPTIIFNLSDANANSIVQDVNFRRAVRACLDADSILLSTKTDPTQYEVDGCPMMPSSPYYNDILNQNMGQDLEKAKEYLEASGYNGETIRWWCADSDSYYTTALPASENLKAIGVNVELSLMDVTTYEASYNDPNCADFDICCRETQKSYLHPLLSQFVSGYLLWDSPERTEIIERLGSTAAGSEESIQAFTDFCTLLDDQVPYIILGDFGTVCWYSANMIPDRQGVDMYWWNSYFKAA